MLVLAKVTQSAQGLVLLSVPVQTKVPLLYMVTFCTHFDYYFFY